MPGTYSIISRAAGSLLTAAVYMEDHQAHLTFNTPGGCDDYSTIASQMQSAVDPGEVGTESPATDLAGELQRIRKIITEITGKTYWYESPVGSLADFDAPLQGVRGLVGANHATTTQYTLSSVQQVCLVNPLTGSSIVRTNPGSLTVDALTAGPAANGRDQAGAFANPSWLHLYYIWNGTLLRLTASTAAPTTGPALPTGYTHWAYATTIYYTAEFQPTVVKGNRVYNDLAGFTGLASTSFVTIGSLASIVPPLATYAFGLCSVSGTATAGGVIDITLFVSSAAAFPVVSVAIPRLFLNGATGSSALILGSIPFLAPLLTAQTLYYVVSTAVGSGGVGSVTVQGYVVPNGDS